MFLDILHYTFLKTNMSPVKCPHEVYSVRKERKKRGTLFIKECSMVSRASTCKLPIQSSLEPWKTKRAVIIAHILQMKTLKAREKWFV